MVDALERAVLVLVILNSMVSLSYPDMHTCANQGTYQLGNPVCGLVILDFAGRAIRVAQVLERGTIPNGWYDRSDDCGPMHYSEDGRHIPPEPMMV